jgi:hypothetical protein
VEVIQHIKYPPNTAYIILLIEISLGGGGLLSTPTSFSISKNIVNLQSNEILFNTQTKQQQLLLIG